MKELLVIGENKINGIEAKTINARELHAFLESRKDFSSWIKTKLMAYGFEEDRDFCIERIYTQYGQLDKIDYHLTIDTAKELSMIERNLKGREARKYFIECEKRFKAVKARIEDNMAKVTERIPTAKFDATMLGLAIDLLKPSENSKLMMVQKLFDKHGADRNLLPVYTEKVRPIFSATKLLLNINSDLSIRQFNSKMLALGYLEKKTRQSRKTESKVKDFLALTEKGLVYGQNDVSPQNPLETQPHYYEDSFGDLVKILTIGV